MTLDPNAESQLLRVIRRVPESDADAAWRYAADRLRPILWPTMSDINDICGEIVRRYGGYERESNDASA
jgi:hypothetical protein